MYSLIFLEWFITMAKHTVINPTSAVFIMTAMQENTKKYIYGIPYHPLMYKWIYSIYPTNKTSSSHVWEINQAANSRINALISSNGDAACFMEGYCDYYLSM